jgi:hypothetical protein
MEDGSNPDGYVEAGKVFLGTYLTMPGFAPDVEFTDNSTSHVEFSQCGQVYGDDGYQYRTFQFNFPLVTESERQTTKTMFATVGNHTPIFLTVWESNTSTEPVIYGIITESAMRYNQQGQQGLTYSMAFSFREVF